MIYYSHFALVTVSDTKVDADYFVKYIKAVSIKNSVEGFPVVLVVRNLPTSAGDTGIESIKATRCECA